MPEPEILAIGLRHLERLLIVCAGALAIWLGYRMFLAMPHATEGESKIQLPGGVSIFVSRVGPGVFFALFGALVLYYSMRQAVQFSVGPASGQTVAGARTFGYSGIADAAPAPVGIRPEERTRVVDNARQLAAVVAFIDGPAGKALTSEQRIDMSNALREARVRLLASVWDESAWGSFAAFQAWLDNEVEPPPPALAAAVRAYRGAP